MKNYFGKNENKQMQIQLGKQFAENEKTSAKINLPKMQINLQRKKKHL